ncbi:MAG: hypothetical protein JXQ87_12890 [Bacteroidia bacterium]
MIRKVNINIEIGFFLMILISLFISNNSKAQSHIRLEKNGRTIFLYEGQKINYLDLQEDKESIKKGRLNALMNDSTLIIEGDTLMFNDFVFAYRHKLFAAEIYKKPIAMGLIGAGLISSSFAYGIENMHFGKRLSYYVRNFNELLSDYNNTLIYVSSTLAVCTYFYLRNRNANAKLRNQWTYELILENDLE